EPAPDGRDEPVERGWVLAEEERGLDRLELHQHRVASGVARQVDAGVEERLAQRVEDALGDRALGAVDGERLADRLVPAGEARGLADAVGELAVEVDQRALAVA